jgi:uncharacterized membrane protein HdeD (DUF308 family)|tara:strand:+ start:439 stop:621 length:183 start_codon:yes stop_codon:yes gene_type:complete
MAKNEMCGPHSTKCVATTLIVLGVLVILNDKYSWFTWGTFIGGLIVIKGLMKVLHPACKK